MIKLLFSNSSFLGNSIYAQSVNFFSMARGFTEEKRSGKLKSEVIAVATLSVKHIDDMWKIFEKYYADVSFETFFSDLKEKQDVILLTDSGNGVLEGFSTIRVFKKELDGKPYVAIYSGDTIISEQYWGQRALQKEFFLYLLKSYVKYPTADIYWFLISKGYKTYLLMTRNFPNCWPRHSVKTPNSIGNIVNHLSLSMFGDNWKPELGLLQFDYDSGCLKPDIAVIDDAALLDPDIEYFHRTNPGYKQGDELCCLGKIDFELITSYPTKLLKNSISKRIGG